VASKGGGIMSDLERGMQEAVENLRREREGLQSLADERKFFEALENFLGPQSGRPKEREIVREIHHHHYRQDWAGWMDDWAATIIFFLLGLILSYIMFH
jgi:hypothetical protein